MDKYLIKREHIYDEYDIDLFYNHRYYLVHHPLSEWVKRLYKIDIRGRRYNGLIRGFKRPTLAVI